MATLVLVCASDDQNRKQVHGGHECYRCEDEIRPGHGRHLNTSAGQMRRPGTFDSCGIRNRLDYIFISQSLVPTFAGGEIFRKGVWGKRKTRPTAWETYPEIENGNQQASDHSAVFIDLDV